MMPVPAMDVLVIGIFNKILVLRRKYMPNGFEICKILRECQIDSVNN